MYVILGATGNTGSVIANVLLDMGKKVRVLGRDAKKLAPFVSRGSVCGGRCGQRSAFACV
jgi:uncharacterized protein YbjT (DUF2867 family)